VYITIDMLFYLYLKPNFRCSSLSFFILIRVKQRINLHLISMSLLLDSNSSLLLEYGSKSNKYW